MTGSNAPVLLAYDGSPSSAAAIAAAGRLVKSRQAVVCNVWAPLSRPIFHSEPVQLPGVLSDAAEEIDQIELEGAQRTAAEGVRLAEAAGFSAEPLCVAERDQTWRALLEAAQRVGASMVVTGAHGLSGLRRALLGSVSTGLVHHARLPVLVVPARLGRRNAARPAAPLLRRVGGLRPRYRRRGRAPRSRRGARAPRLGVVGRACPRPRGRQRIGDRHRGRARRARQRPVQRRQRSRSSDRDARRLRGEGHLRGGERSALADRAGCRRPARIRGDRARITQARPRVGGARKRVQRSRSPQPQPVFVVPPAAEADTTEEET